MNICEESGVLHTIYILKNLFKISLIIIPIIIIITSIISFSKASIAEKTQEKIKEVVVITLKKIAAGIFVCLLPQLLYYALSLINVNNLYSVCFEKANLSTINLLEKKEEENLKLQEQTEQYNARNNEKKNEENAKKNHDSLIIVDHATNNGNTTNNSQNESSASNSSQSSPDSSLSNFPSGELTIHVGDSRTVGMCAHMTGSYNGCTYNGKYKISGNDIYIAKSSMSFNWFKNTAVPAVNAIVNSNPNRTYNIISYMGVNRLLGDIDKYITEYNYLAQNDWKNCKLILASVNPVDEAKEAQNNYSTKNSNIITFNNKLKNNVNQPNVSYCDIYNKIKDNFSTSDGLHYGTATDKTIYQIAKSCI